MERERVVGPVIYVVGSPIFAPHHNGANTSNSDYSLRYYQQQSKLPAGNQVHFEENYHVLLCGSQQSSFVALYPLLYEFGAVFVHFRQFQQFQQLHDPPGQFHELQFSVFCWSSYFCHCIFEYVTRFSNLSINLFILLSQFEMSIVRLTHMVTISASGMRR